MRGTFPGQTSRNVAHCDKSNFIKMKNILFISDQYLPQWRRRGGGGYIYLDRVWVY